jgi:hypothetical protein
VGVLNTDVELCATAIERSVGWERQVLPCLCAQGSHYASSGYSGSLLSFCADLADHIRGPFERLLRPSLVGASVESLTPQWFSFI